MPLQPGDSLLNGKYILRTLLGRGGFGFVYLAGDTLLHEQVPIKELIPALVGDEEILRRFLAEAHATMRLTHERIVWTHDVFAERGNWGSFLGVAQCEVVSQQAGTTTMERIRTIGLLLSHMRIRRCNCKNSAS